MKNTRKKVAKLLSLTLCMTSLSTQAFATQIVNDTQMTNEASASVTTPGAIQLEPVKYVGAGYEVDFSVVSYWDKQFEGSIVLTNTGDQTIENWRLGFDFKHEITNIWEAVIEKNEKNTYTLKNLGWNQDIAPGKSVVISFVGNYEVGIDVPTQYDLMATQQEANGYEVNFGVTGDWGDGFNGELSITNTSDKPIEDWQLEFDFDRAINSFWTAQLVSHQGNHYVIKNDGYNGTILPGQTIKLGFDGTPGGVVQGPINYNLIEVVEGVDYEKDTDNDGLPDYFEKLIGTAVNNRDTDNDGLTDYIEYAVIETNPLKVDTDDNGIEDGNEDYDKDGIGNKKEIELGSKPHVEDTDQDGLTDGEEVNQYNTSPLQTDTDADSLTDFEEIKLGLDPLNPITDGVTQDALRTFEQVLSEENFHPQLIESSQMITPSLSGNVSGLIDKNIEVEISDINVYKDNRAVVGEVIRVDTRYENPQLVLNYDVSKLTLENGQTYAKELVVCRVGDDEALIPMDTSYNNNQLSAEINEGGDYLVINTNEFLQNLGIDVLSNIEEVSERAGFEAAREVDIPEVFINNQLVQEPYTVDNNIDYSQEQYTYDSLLPDNEVEQNVVGFKVDNTSDVEPMGVADVTFVIDSTGSMGDEINNVVRNVSTFAEQLVDAYNVNANFAIVEYKDIANSGEENSTIIHTNGSRNWFSMYNTPQFKQAISNIWVSGGGDLEETALDGIETARRLNWRSNASKFIILLTDAPNKNNNRYGIGSMEDEINLLINDGISTSVITSSYYKSHYQNLFTLTDGIYANIYGNFSSELLKLADKIGEDTNKGTWIILEDYQVIRLNDHEVDTDLDTDDDGIKDYDELGDKKTVSVDWAIKKVRESHNILPSAVYKGKDTVDVYKYNTNPVLVDTDFDGLNDGNARDLVKRDKGSEDGNAFSGETSFNTKNGIDVAFTVDYTDFFNKKNNYYHEDLSVLGSVYSLVAYHRDLNLTAGASINGQIKSIFEGFGLEDVQLYNLKEYYADDDISEIAIGHRLVEYAGEKKDIIVVAVRGTNSTIEEWSSNFDVGAYTENYWDYQNPDWKNKENHKGFDVTTNRIYKYVNEYIARNVSPDTQKVMYITGHSRGGGISNILGKMFEDRKEYETYTYTFAAPNTTTSARASNYSTIYNIKNSDDIVTQLPLDDWGFRKYGKTVPYTVSVEAIYEDSMPIGNREGTYEWLTGEEYNNDGGTKRTLNSFLDIVKDRYALYQLDNTEDGTVNPNNKYHTTYEGAQQELERVTQDLREQRIDRYAVAFIDDGILDQVLVQYQPAILMQILANIRCEIGPRVGYDVKGKYVTAKRSFILSSGELPVGGMGCPHYPETYYLIARNNFQPLN